MGVASNGSARSWKGTFAVRDSKTDSRPTLWALADFAERRLPVDRVVEIAGWVLRDAQTAETLEWLAKFLKLTRIIRNTTITEDFHERLVTLVNEQGVSRHAG